MTINNKTKGYITLGNVIAVGSMALAVAISLLVIGINTYEETDSIKKGTIVQSLADACAEIALNEIKINKNYAGNETLTINDDTCKIEPTVFNQDGSITLNVSGTKNDTTSKLQIIISGTTPSVQISSWKSVSDF